ncbi:MAG: hypothetical protein IJH75_05630 [Mogibacterium sp.]|nr:hypothetical protein [Mogibacterium sp.]
METQPELFEACSRMERRIIEGYICAAARGEKITVRSITEDIGINRSTFYSCFDNIQSVYDAIRDEFVRCARQILIPAGRKVGLLQMLTDWARFCRVHSRIYLAMREMPGGDFAERITGVWSDHLDIMLNLDMVPSDSFRRLHQLYIPTTNENTVYMWLKHQDQLELSDRQLAQIFNNQRVHYVTTALASQLGDRGDTVINEYMTSEVISMRRMRSLLDTGKEDFIRSTFTEDEILQAEESYIPPFYYAQFYAGKRAISRSVTGHIDKNLFPHISIRMIRSNTPLLTENTNVTLTGPALELAEENNINRIRLTTAAESEYVTAFVLSTI